MAVNYGALARTAAKFWRRNPGGHVAVALCSPGDMQSLCVPYNVVSRLCLLAV